MKLYIVSASDYDAHSTFGIFDTEEKAEFCMDEVIREDGDLCFYLPNQFEIEEIDLNAIYYTGFYSYLWNLRNNQPEMIRERMKQQRKEDAIQSLGKR